MYVKLYIPKGPGNEQIRNIVISIVTDVASRMELQLAHIETLAIAWTDQYAHAVSELFGGSFTNSEAYVGVAMARTAFENGMPKHTLLFKDFVFELILQGLQRSEKAYEWPAELQMGPFIVSHEIGHCKDAEIRGLESNSIRSKHPDTFDLDKIHPYYFDVFTSEFFACWNADSFYTLAHLTYQASEELKSLSVLQEDALATRQDLANPNHIYHVAVKASVLVWTYLIQYAKLWAGKQGTTFEENPLPSILNFEFPNPKVTEELDDYLHQLSGAYPEIPDHAQDTLTQIWQSAALYIGYKFVRSDQGWACYWNE